MKFSKVILVAIIFCLSSSVCPIYAQQQTMQGLVIDAKNGNPLPGAYIQQKGYNIHSSSDLNGRFQLIGVHIEELVQITYLGYKPKELSLANIALDKPIVVKLEPLDNLLETVKVSANLEGQQKALNQQRTADNIKNIISADVIGRFPDLNVAEALQRVPGINIQRDKGEGSTIALRGTPAHFTTVQINGEQLPSVQQSGARNEALDLIPADQLASIEVIKAPTPDLDGDAIGGIVNLRTPTAAKLRWSAKAEGSLGYNDISGGLNGIGKLRVDKRFLSSSAVPEGKLGVLLSGSYYSSNNSEDRMDALWGTLLPIENYSFRKTMNERSRTGLTGTFDFKANAAHHFILNYMYNQREDNDIQNRKRFDFDRSNTRWISDQQVTGARARRDINLWDEDKTNHNISLQGYHHLDTWNIDWAGSYTRSYRDFSSTRGDFSYDNIDLGIENEGGIYSDYPVFVASNPQLDLYDPLLYSDFRRYEEDLEHTKADNLTFRLDISKQGTLWDFPATLKFGGKYRSQSNSKFRNNQVLSFFDPNEVLHLSEAFTRVIGSTQPANFLFRDYRFGPLIDKVRFEDYIHRNRFLLTQADDAWDARRLSLNDTYDAYEDIYAGYAMGRLQVNKLLILAGLRLESNAVEYDAFEVFRTGTTVEAEPINGKKRFHFVLPHVHLKYGIDELTNLRLSVLRNYARANFVDIVPFVNYDVDALTLHLGNPELRPSTSWNADIMLERYFSNAGLLSLGLFYKDIDNFQFTSLINSIGEPFPGYPETQGFRFQQEQNGEHARVGGAEINLYRTLDFLPGIARGLSVNANYTFAHSNAFTQDRSGINLPGQAKHTFNAMLSWDYRNFTVRGSVNYNGSYAQSIANEAAGDIIQRHRTQLDLNASYRYKSVRLFTEWINLLNAPSIRYEGDPSRMSRTAFFGYAARVGLSYSIN